MRRPLLLAAPLLPLAAAAVALLAGGGEGGPVPLFEVRRQAVARRVTAEGTLRAQRATPLAAPLEAQGALRIAWLAPDGSFVRAGEVVVRFDPTDMEKRRDDAQSDRASASFKIAKEKVESRTQLANLERDAQAAELELATARDFQKKDETLYSRQEIIESEIDANLAAARRAHAADAQQTREQLHQTDLELLAIEARKAEIQLRQARLGLDGLEIRAPHDGLVVFQRDWRGNPVRVGDTTWRGQTLAQIPDLARMEAEVFVLEADAGGLAVGQEAELTLEAHPERVFPARVRHVDSLAKPRQRGSPVQYFALVLELATTDPEVMKPGQRVRATLTLEELAGVVTVPRQAVFEGDGGKVVYRRSGRGFEPVPVTLGAATLGRVVVAAGLAEGDVIALVDPTRSPSGDPEPAPSEPVTERVRPGAP